MTRPLLSDPSFDESAASLRRRLVYATIFLFGLLLAGVLGYRLLDPQVQWLDALYMTVISLTTVGYGEFVQPTPGVRVFTIVLLLTGMGGAAYFVSTATAFVLEGSLGHVVWRRRMLREIASYENHHLVCGSGETALYAARELCAVKRKCVVICEKAEAAEELRRHLPGVPILAGDASTDEALQMAGIARAAGVIACEESTKDNLLITLAARQLNPRARIVTRVAEITAEQKARTAGANSVVCPSLTGGLRLASELVRPTVVSFLDVMLRDRDRNLRVDEVQIAPDSAVVGRQVGSVDFRAVSNALLLAIKMNDGQWTYNPPEDLLLVAGHTLIVMGSPEDVGAVRDALNHSGRAGAAPNFIRPAVPV